MVDQLLKFMRALGARCLMGKLVSSYKHHGRDSFSAPQRLCRLIFDCVLSAERPIREALRFHLILNGEI